VESPDPAAYLDPVVALANALLQDDAESAADAVTALAWRPLAVVPRVEPSIRVIAEVYERDRYRCRYCGRQVVLTAVLRMLSRRYPDALPYQANWATSRTHPVFSALSATLDHVEPVAAGGDPLGLSNIVCACWRYNRRKGDLSLEELGWSLREVTDDDWRGLADLYVPLWHALGSPALGDYDREWMRGVTAVTAQRRP
jgi:hypothetical protein